MPEEISPEEKLLHLIKGDKKTAADSPESDAALAPLSATAGEMPEKKPGILITKKKRRLGDPFLLLNRFLVIVLLGVLAFMVLGYIYPYKSRIQIPDKVAVSITQKLSGEAGEITPLDYYTGKIGGRQMFKIYEPPKPKRAEPQKPKVTLQQLIAGYTFVGIIFDAEPKTIVEEKRSGRNYQLKAGQSLGEIKIEKIERGKVTISYEDQTMEVNI